MEEDEYKAFYQTLNQHPCQFEKAVLSSRCACSKAQRLNLAEREAVVCTLQAARLRCQALLDALHQNARFALKQAHQPDAMPHGKEMKVQCGGLQGLQAALFPESGEGVGDIAGLVEQAVARFGGLEHLPYQEIVRAIAHYQVRKGRREKP